MVVRKKISKRKDYELGSSTRQNLSWSDIQIVKRHPSIFTKEQSAVIVIDMQEKLFNTVQNRYEIIKNSELILKSASILNVPVIVTEQYPNGLGKTVDRINNLLDGCSFVEKLYFSAVGEKDFLEIIEEGKIKKFSLIGIETHICVLQTALDLKVRGYDVTVAANAVSSRRTEDKEIALERMSACGITIASAEGIVFEMLERAGTEEFKKVLEIVRR